MAASIAWARGLWYNVRVSGIKVAQVCGSDASDGSDSTMEINSVST